MATLTQARALEYFNYDPDTGDFLVKERPASEFNAPSLARHRKRIGRPSGRVDTQGYRKLCVDGRYYLAHKIAWLICFGEWVEYPAFEIDHINGKRDDNRILNLRKVSKSGNQRNTAMRANNTSGVHGVNRKYDKWVARIWNGPRHVYLGQFDTLHEAQIARRAAERVLGFTIRREAE